MEYDEKIVKAMNEEKTGVTGNIQDGLFIREVQYEFQEEVLLDGAMKVMLPIKFIDMPADFAKLKYPSENRPPVIKMSKDGGINFGFNILELPGESEYIEEYKNSFRNACKNAFPANVFFDELVEEADGTKMGWFSYRSHTTDGPIFNIMMCRPLNKRFYM